MRVAQIGNPTNDTRLSSEQRGGQDWQRRILRAADLDRTRKRMAAVDENFIHTSQTGNVSHLNNRFSKKCRGNFFPPGSKEALRFGHSDSQLLPSLRYQAPLSLCKSVTPS